MSVTVILRLTAVPFRIEWEKYVIRKGMIILNFNDIYKQYFARIFNYCYAKLKDYKLAEECTQDVFLAFYKKMSKLKLTTNVEAWLYKAARFQLTAYYRKFRNDISFDTLTETEEPVTEIIQDEGILNDIINEDELKILTDFYVDGESIDKLAEDSKMSQAAIYQRLRRIKQKIIQNADKLHNFIKQ